MKFRFGDKAVIFRSKPGEISEKGCWVCFQGIWMYCGNTFLGLLIDMAQNWKNDRNLVG